MDTSFRNEKDSSSHVEMTPGRSDSDHDGLNKVMKQQAGQFGHGEGGKDCVMETSTMTLGLKTETGQFVELPSEVLGMILTKVDNNNDLLKCRLVNGSWQALTCPILRQREFCRIKFSGSDRWRTYHHTRDLARLIGCLVDCKKLFGSLDSFPCVRVILSNLILEETKLQRFLDLYGPLIQSLHMHDVQVSVEDGQLKSLSRLLTQQAPNISHLTLKFLDTNSEGIPTVLFDNKHTKLPHLQTLDQAGMWTNLETTIMKEIIEAADNLKIYNPVIGFENLDQLDFFVSTGKVQTLKKMWMENSRVKMELYEKFAGLQLKLVSFGIFDYLYEDPELLARAAGVINKVLESSKDSLTTLDLFYQEDQVPGLHFPVLKKVKQLNINYRFGTNFPRGQSLSRIFPKVCEIHLDLMDLTSSFWSSFMENNLPSVHTLTIKNHFEKIENVQDLSRFFPKVKRLVVIKPALDVVGAIFSHMKGLESLEFFKVPNHDPTSTLDSALTGFSPATCLRLADSSEILEDGEVEKLREKVSILELTDLRTLKITGAIGFDRPIVSRVSGIWAFQKMPQVNVTVTAFRGDNPAEDLQIKAALDSIAPFVHSVGFY